ncbi:nitroreductase family protein [Candidatus Woesearchaeota archaeon]|nr:nitroreductase family protein [Candidatus Woesearchaeota archaeon]
METLECIRTRRSVRRYKDKLVGWDKITQLLEAGKMAPSAGNIQNWKFIVIRNEAVIKKIAQASFDQDWMEDAPVHIVIAADPGKTERFYGARGKRLYTIQGCAAAVENIMLAANDLGLGSCWIGAFDESKVKRALNMPEKISPQAIITIGHPDEKPNMPPRVELEHQVYLDRWFAKGVGPRSRGYKSVAIKETIQNTAKALKKAVKKIKKK